jgi:1-acyl-sn-glycerol-3-phosphate acyltransferase
MPAGTERSIGAHVNAWYRAGSRLFEAGFRTLGIDLRSIGHDNIPDRGPVVLASNHIGYLDFAFVSLAPPRPRRPVRFLARHEFFEQPVAGPLLRRLEQIPVDVHGDALSAAQAAQTALEQGDVVGLHPEGTISPSFVPRRAKSGAVRLADAAGAPLVPVAVWGSQRLLTKGRPPRPSRGVVVTVRYGEPFVPSGRTGAARTRELMARITDLVDESQRTYPQRAAGPPHDWWVPAHLGGSAPTPEEAEQRLAAQEAERRARRTAATTTTTTTTEP